MSKEEGLLLDEIVYRPHYTNAVEIKVYDSAENMYKGAHKWNEKYKKRYCLTDDYDAVTLENLPNTVKKEFQIFCTIFIYKEKLNYFILSHEFNHATFCLFRNIYRFDCKFERINGTGMDEEEIFCYTQEYFLKSFIAILNKKNIEI